MSNCYQIAEERRKQINAEFKKTKRQISDATKEGRRERLNHLSKLYKKVSGRDRSTLRAVGAI